MAKAITTCNLLAQLLLTSGGELSLVFSCVDVAAVNVVLDGVSISGASALAKRGVPREGVPSCFGTTLQKGQAEWPLLFPVLAI